MSTAPIVADWDDIVLDAVTTYYKNLNFNVTKSKVANFFSYSQLVKAVSSMKVQGNNLICDPVECAAVTKMWNAENTFVTAAGAIFSEDNSAVKKVLEGLVVTARFKNASNDLINDVNNSNLFKNDITNYVAYSNQKMLRNTLSETQSGGRNKTVSVRPWQKNLTLRLQHVRDSVASHKKK